MAKRKTATKAKTLVANTDSIVRDRLQSFLGYSHNGARDLYKVFGYEREVPIPSLFEMYRRNDIASRIIRSFPQATWRDCPLIGDDDGDGVEEEGENFSAFAKAANDFITKKKVLSYLERADRLGSIGRHSILLMGFKDGAEALQPMSKRKADLLFMSPYLGEISATISRWDTNQQSERFGLPEIYNVQNTSLDGNRASPTKSFSVHHSRVLHITEFLDQDEVFGMPRLLPVYNRLKDLEKVVGGASETFWLTANRGMLLAFDKDSSIDPVDIALIKEQADEFTHQLRRNLIGSGVTPHVLGSDTPDPEMNVSTLLDLISGSVGIPKRILIGSERGELASGQDENNWIQRIDERRRTFAVPMMLRPFLQKMIDTGNLPAPKGEFWCEWAKPAVSESELATIAVQTTQAIVAYSNSPTAAIIVPPQEFRRDVLHMPPESEYDPPAVEQPLNENDPNLQNDPNANDPAAGNKPNFDLTANYDDSQPRADDGRWTDGAIGGKHKADAGQHKTLGAKGSDKKVGKAADEMAQSSVEGGISQDEYDGFGYYARDSTAINSRLRHGSAAAHANDLVVQERMDGVFARTALTEDVAAWRVVDPDFATQLRENIGGSITDQGYVSTTARRNVATSIRSIGNREIVRVHIPRGARALPIAAAHGNSYASQYEVLIDRGSTFDVSQNGRGELVLTMQERR